MVVLRRRWVVVWCSPKKKKKKKEAQEKEITKWKRLHKAHTPATHAPPSCYAVNGIRPHPHPKFPISPLPNLSSHASDLTLHHFGFLPTEQHIHHHLPLSPITGTLFSKKTCLVVFVHFSLHSSLHLFCEASPDLHDNPHDDTCSRHAGSNVTSTTANLLIAQVLAPRTWSNHSNSYRSSSPLRSRKIYITIHHTPGHV